MAATHGLLVGPVKDRLGHPAIHRLLITDTLAAEQTHRLPLQVRSVAPLLADVINRLHHNKPLDTLLMHA
ncbi:hypothetical protein ACH4YO_27650 [Streptomyces noursei]|uniref:hypothetical protein n=1 Tax=Streptomyces noursei TaxID=1971 RepID=UPI0033C6323E